VGRRLFIDAIGSHWPMLRLSLKTGMRMLEWDHWRPPDWGRELITEERVHNFVRPLVRPTVRSMVVASFALGGSAAPTTAFAGDDFPLVGNYTQNVACKGDGSDQAVARVTISPQEIVSNVGVCTILDRKQDGRSISAHVECKFAGGPLMGDVTFTPRPDNTIEFIDGNMTYKAVLYRCPQ